MENLKPKTESDILKTKVEDLDISEHLRKNLKKAKILTLSDLKSAKQEDLEKIRGFTRKDWEEIKHYLIDEGLREEEG